MVQNRKMNRGMRQAGVNSPWNPKTCLPDRRACPQQAGGKER